MAAAAGLLGRALVKGIRRSTAKASKAPKRGRPAKVKYGGKYRTTAKAKVRNDGEGNKAVAFKYGKKVKPLKYNMEQKIRSTLTPIDTLVRQSVGIDGVDAPYNAPWTLQDHFATGQYRVFEIGNVEDIDKIITRSLNEDVTRDLQTYIKDYSMQIKLVNQMNTVVNIRTYEYVARNSLPNGTYGATQVLAHDGFLREDPHEISSDSIGGTLFQNSAFCTYNKIVKVRNITLAPGKEYVVTLKHNKGYKVNSLLLADNITRQRYTRGVVLQYMGSPCNGPRTHEGDEQAMKLPGVSQFKVVWSFFKRFHFMNISSNKGSTYLEDLIPYLTGGVTPVEGMPKWGAGQGAQIMNQESGDVEPTERA